VGVGGRGSEALVQAVRDLDAAGVETRGLALRRPSLDDVFLALTGHAAEDEGPPGGRRRGRRRTGSKDTGGNDTGGNDARGGDGSGSGNGPGSTKASDMDTARAAS
jgi:ABC-2 type transport system ATP-binding protein